MSESAINGITPELLLIFFNREIIDYGAFKILDSEQVHRAFASYNDV